MYIEIIRNNTKPNQIKFDNSTLSIIRNTNNAKHIIFKKKLKEIENNYSTEYRINEPSISNHNEELLDKCLDEVMLLIDAFNNLKITESINQSKKITIIDAIMGTGKTTYIIENIINRQQEQIKQAEEYFELGWYSEFDKQKAINSLDKFICVLPTLKECNRYKEAIYTNIEVFEPDAEKGKGSKLENFKELIKRNKNIATTHALIQLIDEECIEYLRASNYILIIDEELNVVEPYKKMAEKDIKALYDLGYIIKNDNGFLVWNEQDDETKFRYDDVKRLCNLGCLMEYANSNNRHIVIWNFPPIFFDLFKKCYICTYLWDGSIQKHYFNLHNINYEHKTLIDGKLVDYDKSLEREIRTHYKSLIDIYEGGLNVVGDSIETGLKGRPSRPLCSTWYDKHIKIFSNDSFTDKEMEEKEIKRGIKKKYSPTNNLIKVVKNNTSNYFKNIKKSRATYNMWTVYKGNNNKIRNAIKGDGYANGFVPCNCKGTNEFKDRINLAYLIDYNISPVESQFFKQYNIQVNEDLYSLSVMLQWIWRSAIREHQAISIYIPSQRMRTLLKSWLNNEI